MKMKVTSNLKTLSLTYDYTTVCDDFKFIFEKKYDSEFDCDTVQRKIELVNPIDYTREELFEKYDKSTKVIKWMDTFTENDQPTMAVVLEKKD